MQESELINPIHLTQPNEKPRPNFYRQKFFEYNGNIQQYISHLEKTWKNHGRTLEELTPEICKELEKYFTPGDIEKNAKCHNLIIKGEKKVSPGESIISKWSACNLWLTRKPSFLNSRQEELNQFMLQADLETSQEIYSLQKEARLLNLQDLVLGLKSHSINGTQAQAKGQLNKSLQDAENRDKGQVKDINQTNMEATVETESKLAHDFNDDVLGVISDAITRRNTNNTG